MGEEKVFNGIHARTGRYLDTPADRDLPALLRKPPLDPAGLREYRWWTERYGIDDPERAPVRDVDPNDLASAGWVVVFAPDVPQEVEDALQPLLKRRQDAAGRLFKTLRYRSGQLKQDFLAVNGASDGPANPIHVPYYVLLVGGPRSIPFRFQFELDVQYAVGRIHFDGPTPAETYAAYANYARGVVDAETKAEARRPRELTFFGVSNKDDRATERSVKHLIEPLADVIQRERAWPVRRILRDEAVKPHLGRLLGGEETPAFLFTATHGVAFDPDDVLQLACQGALLCQEWPGPNEGPGEVSPAHYFSASDVPDEADVRGLIACFFACHSAGTPETSDFFDPTQGTPKRLASFPFLSGLAQRLLGHPKGGALAVLGHIDRAWTTSFSWRQESQIDVFENTVKTLLDGLPVGAATEYLNQRYAELAVETTTLFMDFLSSHDFDSNLLSRVWQAGNDARNFVVIGDPAVRLVTP